MSDEVKSLEQIQRWQREKLFEFASFLPSLIGTVGVMLVMSWLLHSHLPRIYVISWNLMLGANYLIFLPLLLFCSKHRYISYENSRKVLVVLILGAGFTWALLAMAIGYVLPPFIHWLVFAVLVIVAMAGLIGMFQDLLLQRLFISSILLPASLLLLLFPPNDSYTESILMVILWLFLWLSSSFIYRYYRELTILKFENHQLQLEKQANRAKSRFLANISHEIRTPLHTIIEVNRVLKESGEQEKNTDLIQKSADILLGLLDDLLDYSSFSSGQGKLIVQPFQFADVIQGLQEKYRPVAEASHLEFRLQVSDALLGKWVNGDVVKITQMMSNLLGNAFKFTSRGFVVLRFHATEEQDEIKYCFEVEDSGIGFDIRQKDKLFQTFTQLDDSLNRNYSGTGLGLAVVHQTLSLMQGTIEVSSASGKGSLFAVHFSLPKAILEKKPDIQSKDILVVEDEKTNQLILKNLLKKMGLSVVTANNGAEALEMAKNKSFGCVFMDLHMPVMDGLSATREMRKLNSDHSMVIIALTANTSDEDRQACYDAGMDEFLTKPFDKEKLKITLSRFDLIEVLETKLSG